MASPSDSIAEGQKPKRFKAVPTETTKRSNRDAFKHKPAEEEKNEKEEELEQAPLLPHEQVASSPEQSKTPMRRKFAVAPVESSTKSNRKAPEQSQDLKGQGIETTDQAVEAKANDTSKKPARRKFKVELIETTKRSHKLGDSTPALQQSDKTNASPGDATYAPKPLRPPITPLPPTNTPHATTDSVPLAQLLKPIPNRQGSMKPHNNTRAPTRAHSFKVPNLASIASSESDRSESASVPHSGSQSPTKDRVPEDATRMRESVDNRFSGYLLALAARAAEKQLRDQEAALYPSTDKHEPVMHYVDHEDSGSEADSPPGTVSVAVPSIHPTRRDSGDEKLMLREMQRHGEQRRREETRPASTEQRNKVNFDSNAGQGVLGSRIGGTQQRDPDLGQMRKAAAPPMLGGDLEFPRCATPEHARFDVTQGSDHQRRNMCYLMGQDGPEGGLWGGLCQDIETATDAEAMTGSNETRVNVAKSPRPSKLSSRIPSNSKLGGGLWGGLCNAADAKTATIPAGLMTPKRTPATENEDPLAAFAPGSPGNTSSGGATIAGPRQNPKSLPLPPSSATGTVPISPSETPTTPTTSAGAPGSSAEEPDKATITARLKHEFPDSFVTQVYNYLALGFPALARKYDEELAKISGMSVSELRRDDSISDQRGCLRLGEDGKEITAGVARTMRVQGHDESEEVVEEEMCKRWCALRIYVREWGRQMGCAIEGGEIARRQLDPSRAWGVPARKGSWGH